MKTIFALLAFASLLNRAENLSFDGSVDNRFRDPFRRIDQTHYSLAPIFARPGILPTGEIHGFPGWHYLRGEVIQCSKRGVLLAQWKNKTIYIKNYPEIHADGTKIDVIAKEDGLFTYRTVLGSLSTVTQYDYGIPYTPTNITVVLPAPAIPAPKTNTVTALRPSAFDTNAYTYKSSGNIITK